jgi:transposase, IS30 family
MKKQYKHLSGEERDRIAVLRAQGFKVRAIARELKRDPATLSRELRRNRSPVYNIYLAQRAHQRAAQRKRVSVQRERIRDKRIQRYIMKKLKQRWSPEIISNLVSSDLPGTSISPETIYQFIYHSPLGQQYNLKQYLIRAHRLRKARGYSRKHTKSHIPQRVSIDHRPPLVLQRTQPGHWESDAIISRQSPAAIAVMLERKTRKVKLTKLPAKTSHHFKNALTRCLSHYPPHMRQSITYDNGSENVQHMDVNYVLGTTSYFCHPFHSWEKGSVENVIGLVRIFLPKRTDFTIVTKEHLKKVERTLNNRPRKCLGYLTPNQSFASSVALRY